MEKNWEWIPNGTIWCQRWTERKVIRIKQVQMFGFWFIWHYVSTRTQRHVEICCPMYWLFLGLSVGKAKYNSRYNKNGGSGISGVEEHVPALQPVPGSIAGIAIAQAEDDVKDHLGLMRHWRAASNLNWQSWPRRIEILIESKAIPYVPEPICYLHNGCN